MTTPEQWLIFGVFAVIAAIVLLFAAIAGSGRLGELPDPITDHFIPELPDRPLTPVDIEGARFATTARGYSPAQVDRLLAHAARHWRNERDGVPVGPLSTPGPQPVGEAAGASEAVPSID